MSLSPDPKSLNPPGIEQAPTRGSDTASYALILLTLLAPVLGGSTMLWAQAAVAMATGLFLLAAPPKRSLGPFANALFLAFLILALTAYLPAQWFAADSVRQAFAGFGVALPPSHTPQPWITLESVLLLVLGLGWFYTLLSHDWRRQRRTTAWRLYAIGILLLAATLIVGNVAKAHLPFWPAVKEFGFFPNRNQTANVLSLAGIIIYAMGLQRLQENRRDWWVWFASLSVICWALILNFSRAGILLLIFGALAVQIYWWITSEDSRRTFVSLGGLFLLAAIFVINGSATLDRFRNETLDFLSPSRNLRLTIYPDALNLLAHSSVFGIGLGNFQPIFSVHRHYSFAPNETIHPESDWLWSAIELGWFAPILLVLFLVWWFKQCSPFERGTLRLMRVAAFVCACAFAVHGLFDVSGHRIGALWPVLFLAATAIHPDRAFASSRWLARIFRVLGLVLIGTGSVWLFSAVQRTSLPTTATLRNLVETANNAVARNDFSSVIEPATEGLRIAPLNWMLYHDRAAAVAVLYFSDATAVRDFKVARFLLPQWPELYMQEGRVWIAVKEEDRAFEVWSEALRRFPEEAPKLYRDMLNPIQGDSELVAHWRELGRENPKCLLMSLRNAGPAEFRLEVDRLLAEDPDLRAFNTEERKIIFHEWYEHGDKLALAETLRHHPEWQKFAWPQLARAYADYQDYRQAYETVMRFSPRPHWPTGDTGVSVDSLVNRFKVSGDVERDGLPLVLAQVNRGEIKDALAVLKILEDRPRAPRYLHFLEGELWARQGDWLKAWQAMWKYESLAQ